MTALINDVSLGLWVDSPRSQVLKRDFIDIFVHELRFDLLAIMIDRSDKDPTYQWKPSHVERILELTDPYAIEVVLTTWPYPDKDQIDRQCEQMTELMNVGSVAAWEEDLEFNWKSKKKVNGQWVSMVHGFENLDKAGDYLVEKTKEVCLIQDARFEMTSFTEHVENSSKSDVGPEADRLLVQAYSVSNRNKKEVSWNSRNGPGKMQMRTLNRTMSIPGVNAYGPKLGVGLAAWSQRFSGYQPDNAMQVALDKTLEYYPIDIRWWSSKHVIGSRANPYAFKFLKSLRNPS